MKVENYGDLIAQVTGKKLIGYIEFGSYQGDYIAVLESENNVELWRGSYGSCSGCDWIEGEKNWEDSTIPDEIAREYLRDEKPYLIIPKDKLSNMTLETFKAILPANIHNDIYEFDPNELYEEVVGNRSQF